MVNLDERVVSVDDHPVHLTGKEYGILELLSLRKGKTLTKEMILDHLFETGYQGIGEALPGTLVASARISLPQISPASSQRSRTCSKNRRNVSRPSRCRILIRLVRSGSGSSFQRVPRSGRPAIGEVEGGRLDELAF